MKKLTAKEKVMNMEPYMVIKLDTKTIHLLFMVIFLPMVFLVILHMMEQPIALLQDLLNL